MSKSITILKDILLLHTLGKAIASKKPCKNLQTDVSMVYVSINDYLVNALFA